MDAKEFERKVGSPPTQNDLGRVNCTQVGEIGHGYCGWCPTHDKPRFMCGCFAQLIVTCPMCGGSGCSACNNTGKKWAGSLNSR